MKTCNWNPIKNIVCSGGKDHPIKLWDPRSGECITSLKLHKNTVNKLRFNRNGNWLLSASKDQSIKLTDIRVMKEFLNFKDHEKDVNTICWHPQIEDIFCSGGSDGNIIFWNALQENKNYVLSDAHKKEKNEKDSDKKEIYDIAYNNIGNFLVSTGNDNSIKIWQNSPLNTLNS